MASETMSNGHSRMVEIIGWVVRHGSIRMPQCRLTRPSEFAQGRECMHTGVSSAKIASQPRHHSLSQPVPASLNHKACPKTPDYPQNLVPQTAREPL